MRFSLGRKTILLIVCITTAISTLAIVRFSKTTHDLIVSQHGIGMVDLNGLKQTNDTFDHEKVGISNNALCKTICRTFEHSPVYRIGGDKLEKTVFGKAGFDPLPHHADKPVTTA